MFRDVKGDLSKWGELMKNFTVRAREAIRPEAGLRGAILETQQQEMRNRKSLMKSQQQELKKSNKTDMRGLSAAVVGLSDATSNKWKRRSQQNGSMQKTLQDEIEKLISKTEDSQRPQMTH